MEEAYLNPLVSICIPAYNANRYIGSTLQSLVAQTYKNIEIIVVDDGSVNTCEKEVSRIGDARIRYIYQDNGGAGYARNHAFNLSKGEFIKFMDADDLLSSGSIAAQVQCLKQNPNSIVSGKWGRFYKDDLSDFQLSVESVWKSMDSIFWIQESWENGPNMTQPGIFLFSRSLIEKTGLWNESLSSGPMDDMEYYTRLILNAKKVTFCSDSILMYRSGLDDSLSKVKSKMAMETALRTIELATNYLFSYDQSLKSKTAISTQYQIYIYNVYTNHHKLYTKAIELQKKYGGNDFKYQAGGITRILIVFLGWKITKLLKKFLKDD